ncbi:hypothetical protein [Pseudalkalibacillus berkeleyi]|uniref:Flagellar hook-length control protein FliK n=1 Tax=Pseudalkalibacillus berkeleyi TaxID=1069813 RepID=A0ABS9GWC3_9BACL|nr:hypothetical protein [Pseudalkalibacillus berkeleyi]MCF6137089.1 hypothetical protein [Pseudalkalibacillus berkeleyi]
MPVESVMSRIGKFNTTIELKPGQIFSGKVLALYPNDFAKIQLAGRKVNAQLLTGLTLGGKYWFQVKPNSHGTLPLLSVVENNRVHQPPLQSLGIGKLHPNLSKLVQSLANEQLPMTKDLMAKADQWMNQVSSVSKGIQAIKTMVYQNLPQTDAVFKALYHVQDDQPLHAQLNTLKQLLHGHSKTNKGFSNVEQIISRILTSSHQTSGIDTLKQLVHIHNRTDIDPSTQSQLKEIFRSLDLNLPAVNKGSNTIQSDAQFLKALNLPMNKATAELQIQHKLSQMSDALQKTVQSLTDNEVAKPQLKLIETMKSLGLTLERDMIHNQLNVRDQFTQLKPSLVNLLSEEVSLQVREKAETLLHRITGQQLVHSNENHSLTSLFYQIPIHFKEWKSDLLMKWDMKKDQSGKIDEDFSRILFYLDLQNMKETVIDMNVQNRIVSIKIVNDHDLANQLIPAFKDILSDRLGEIGYQLSSVKVELTENQGDALFRHKSIDQTRQGVDFTI